MPSSVTRPSELICATGVVSETTTSSTALPARPAINALTVTVTSPLPLVVPPDKVRYCTPSARCTVRPEGTVTPTSPVSVMLPVA